MEALSLNTRERGQLRQRCRRVEEREGGEGRETRGTYTFKIYICATRGQRIKHCKQRTTNRQATNHQTYSQHQIVQWQQIATDKQPTKKQRPTTAATFFVQKKEEGDPLSSVVVPLYPNLPVWRF
jgi:hypothetical protein